MGQVEVAAQHRHIQVVLAEGAAQVGCQALGEGGAVEGDALYHLGKSQVDAGEALLIGLGQALLQRLVLRAESGVDIVETDSDLHVDSSLLF